MQVSRILRAHVDAWDDYQEEQRKAAEAEDAADNENNKHPSLYGHVHLGSLKLAVSFASFAAQSSVDPAFVNLRFKISGCLANILAIENINDSLPIPLNEAFRAVPTIHDNDQVS